MRLNVTDRTQAVIAALQRGLANLQFPPASPLGHSLPPSKNVPCLSRQSPKISLTPQPGNSMSHGCTPPASATYSSAFGTPETSHASTAATISSMTMSGTALPGSSACSPGAHKSATARCVSSSCPRPATPPSATQAAAQRHSGTKPNSSTFPQHCSTVCRFHSQVFVIQAVQEYIR